MQKAFYAFALGSNWLIAYLAFLSAFVPISTDLYLPALPGMSAYFGVKPGLTNLSLSLFMLFYALSMLMWGPFSDKYGRKRILLIGLILYIAASIWLAVCPFIEQLIAGRCLQALGSGAISSVSLAIVKDTYRGRTMEMENVLIAIQTMVVLAPLLAPVLGGVLLLFTSWRGIFWILAACGCVALFGWCALRETCEQRTQGSVWTALGRVRHVLGHRGFRSLLLVFSLGTMPFMAFLATSAYIYEIIFQATPQRYSYFFAANAAASGLGPLLYLRFFRGLPRREFIAFCYAATGVFGVMIILFGANGPFTFALLFAPVTICGSALRPPTTMLLMNQMDTDTGTVSALVVCLALFFGGLSMLLCSLPWSSFILATGSIAMLVGLICSSGWLWLDRARAFSGQRTG
jgi:DHA1 family bicyclomycin/chloramphenicol resistance-like MFS transporter